MFALHFPFNSGNWLIVQCAQSGSAITFGPCCTETGQIFGIWCGYVDIIAVLLYVGRTLARLHLVFDWTQ